MKYNEREILKHLEEYIESTYSQHYTKGDFQIQDLFENIGIAEEFCRGAAIKYLVRFGKKEGKNSKDLLKCMHYIVLMFHYCNFDEPLLEDNNVVSD